MRCLKHNIKECIECNNDYIEELEKFVVVFKLYREAKRQGGTGAGYYEQLERIVDNLKVLN